MLTRKPGESILVGADVRITLVSSSGAHARIAIEAPDEVAIHREEVYERIVAANREAAMASTPTIDAPRSETASSETERE